jgi:hypothetical protein
MNANASATLSPRGRDVTRHSGWTLTRDHMDKPSSFPLLNVLTLTLSFIYFSFTRKQIHIKILDCQMSTELQDT